MKALFDSNIIVDFVTGHEEAKVELRNFERFISRITWIEVLVGSQTEDDRKIREHLLTQFQMFELDAAVAKEAVLIRKGSRLKLPDAIILATARVHGLLLVTRNHRDFSRKNPEIRIPY